MRFTACVTCGRPEDEHHPFVAAVVPSGCQCEPGEWRDPLDVPPVCVAFVESEGGETVCGTCEHDRECHAAK